MNHLGDLRGTFDLGLVRVREGLGNETHSEQGLHSLLVVTTMTVLTDQQTQAASNHSAFRFLNQAPKTGAVDVYMVPAGATLADSVPLVTALPVGLSPFYVNFTSQSVTMVITPTGNIKLAYTSAPITLVGSEARTVLIMDNKLTSNPPVAVTMVDDAGPAN